MCRGEKAPAAFVRRALFGLFRLTLTPAPWGQCTITKRIPPVALPGSFGRDTVGLSLRHLSPGRIPLSRFARACPSYMLLSLPRREESNGPQGHCGEGSDSVPKKTLNNQRVARSAGTGKQRRQAFFGIRFATQWGRGCYGDTVSPWSSSDRRASEARSPGLNPWS